MAVQASSVLWLHTMTCEARVCCALCQRVHAVLFVLINSTCWTIKGLISLMHGITMKIKILNYIKLKSINLQCGDIKISENRSRYQFVAIYILYNVCIQTCLPCVIRRDLVQMKVMKCVVSGGVVYIFHIEYN